MNRSIMRITLAMGMLSCSTLCLAYECKDAESYRNGVQDLRLSQKVVTAHMAVAVEFLQKQKGLDLNAALRQVMQVGDAEGAKIYNTQLDDIGAQIKSARHDSPETCEAMLQLAREHAAVGQQKMDYIVKTITGEDSEPQPNP